MGTSHRRASLCRLAAMILLAVAGSAEGRLGLPDFTPLVRENTPAVVNISTTQKVTDQENDKARRSLQGPDERSLKDYFQQFFDDQLSPRAYDAQSLGSGFIITRDGYILTNAHVVEDARQIIVRLSDRREFDAQLVGTDARSDLAVLKIPARNLPTVTIGKSSSLQVGEWVLAIGSPFGFEHSVTAGIISAKGRNLPTENYVPFIQTDVPINPGNSGGPLINLDGKVVGINSHIYTRTGGFMGLSFAIPIDLAMDVANQIRKNGRVVRGWLGVLIQDVSRELAKSSGMDRPEGALVSRVIPDSPAARAGLMTGDVIVQYDGREVFMSASLPPMVGRTRVGEPVPIKVIRAGQLRELRAIIAELPAEGRLAGTILQPTAPAKVKRLGISVKVLGAEQAQASGMSTQGRGVMVTEVGEGPAQAAGIHRGDVITQFNRKRVRSIAGLRAIVNALQAGQVSAPLQLRRDGRERSLVVQLRQ